MEAYEIDDLLKQVSPELLASYEKKNLAGATLMGVNEKHKLVSLKWGKLARLWVKVIVCMLITVGLSLGMTLAGMLPFSVFGTQTVVFALILFLVIKHLTKKVDGFKETLAWCRPILENFRKSVGGLDPTWRSPDDRYSETSVRETLIGFAVRLLDAESKFKKERMLEDAATYSVLHYGNWEVKCRDELKNMLRAVEEFGLTFNKADLFRDAKKHLARII